MKKILVFSIVFFTFLNLNAQRGKEANKEKKVEQVVENTDISTNNQQFSKSKNANYYIKIKEGIGVWVDTSKWKVTESSYVSFRHKDKYFLEANLYTYSLTYTDEVHINKEIETWENLFDNFKVNYNEKRTVNGSEIFYLNVNGDFGTTPEHTFGYYKAFGNLTLTFRCVVASSKYQYFYNDVIELFNGLVIR